MQMRNLMVGAVAFVLATILLQFAARRSADNIEQLDEVYEARQIEAGAVVYATHCAECHGREGRAEACFDPQEERIACFGRPLVTPEFFCATYPGGRGENFSSLEAYTAAVVNVDHERENFYRTRFSAQEADAVIAYVLDFEDTILFHCAPRNMNILPDQIWWDSPRPNGDVAVGEQLYEIDYGCAACHGSLEEEGSNVVGPWGGGFVNLGGFYLDENDDLRLYTTAEFVYESILNPSLHIALDCPTGPCAGPPSGMPDNFDERIPPQDMVDLMAYLLQGMGPSQRPLPQINP